MNKKFYCADTEKNFLINMMLEGEYFNLSKPVTSEHFYFQDHQKVFSAIKDLCENGEDPSPIAVFNISGVDKDVIDGIVKGYTSLSTDTSFKYLDNMRQKRMVQALSSDTLNVLSRPNGVNVPDEIQKLSAALTEGLTIDANSDNFSERTRQHLYELSAGSIKGLTTGIVEFDKAVGEMFEGELHILAGFPSVGKSALALQISRNIAKDGHGVRYFSLEENEQNYMKRIISSETGFPYSAYRNGLTSDQRKQQGSLYTKVFGKGGSLEDKNFEIDDYNDSLEAIYLACAKHKKKYGLNVVIVDGATNINHRESNIYNRSEDIAQSMLRMAKRLKITVILLSHINNDLMRKDKEGQKKRPDMSCLMGGQCLVKPAFSVTILDRVTEEFVPNKPTDVVGYLVKSRNSAPNQVMEFSFDGVKQTYSSKGEKDRW